MGSYYSKKFTGEFWTGKVYFDPHCDSDGTRVYKISDEELNSALAQYVNPFEEILAVWLFKCKMYDWQLSSFFLHHAFIVVQTHGYFWSLEKTSSDITIQRSRYIECVRDKCKRQNRRKVHQVDAGRSRVRMMEIVRLMCENHELKRRYHGFKENCQDFAYRIFNEIADLNSHIYAVPH